ncbi:hypothetical protein EJ06DRAFT_582318 [Trichodelitschia bisporula]|uniref:tRNA (guanine(37)-N1)-methyltransferase n=1 Tax=Trichodelitschia bisporula TaxID=703511 RepID=A0A6G1HWU4_9PEZI|nr:hypothetical protein EJ06DRAFT_582318 [Trichodelitschia bisporula]
MAEKLLPPVNRAMRTLDRAFFKKTFAISAARIFNNKHIAQCRKDLERSHDALGMDRLMNVTQDPSLELAKEGRRCILLRPDIKANDSSTWGKTVTELVESQRVGVIPYDLELDYDYWSYRDIMSSILPLDEQKDLPTGFTVVGHVAHLNLREPFLPYKHLIGQVILDKGGNIRTVINKIDTVGEESEYRTFSYEVLAGPDDLNVEVKEQDCFFHFNYANVYWNSRLHTEHGRLVSTFKEGDVVCDVMAGVGPFAVPAGKRRVFVWANDLNPESYASLEANITRNKVDKFVRPYNRDGRMFIREAVAELYHSDHSVQLQTKVSRSKKERPQMKTYRQPKVFNHFVMNLPATAITFLPSFIGAYSLAQIPPSEPMPKIHVYCFDAKEDDNAAAFQHICDEISRQLEFKFKPGDEEKEGEVQIWDVRDVAPGKRMFCATFRLPFEVAHRPIPEL